MMPRLVVDNSAPVPEPPYPADVLARGWGFTLEVERLTNSDTWSLTPPELRPWLLMVWMQSWVQTPAGSLPDDDELIAGRIGMPVDEFRVRRSKLMRGWYRASDGRLYHKVLTELVERMRDSRRRDREKKAKQRHPDIRRPRGLPGESLGRPPTIQEQEQVQEQVLGILTDTLLSSAETTTQKPSLAYQPPGCPHGKILALWAEILPELHQHDPDEWRGARADNLRARWREAAIKEGPKKARWANEQDGIVYFRRLFQWIRLSEFLMGKTRSAGDRRPFSLKLEWLVRPANWAKVIEGQYHAEEPTA